MAKARTTSWNNVWLRDKKGNECVCSLDSFKQAKDISSKSKYCFDASTMAVGGDNQ